MKSPEIFLVFIIFLECIIVGWLLRDIFQSNDNDYIDHNSKDIQSFEKRILK